MTRMRLHKFMAASGVGSRRACEELITQGRVEVDGKIITELGTQVDDALNKVRCDGRLLHSEPHLYYLLHKPRGAICSMASMPGKPRAVDYLPQRARDRRLFTIGRLDVDSEGALILTNDGELCHLVSHPRFGVHKLYRVEVEGVPDDATIETMRKGVWLSEGRTGPVDIEVVHRFRERTVLAIALQEGRKREIRRVCARFGHEVRHLTRMSIGPVELGDLLPGEVRPLHPAEVDSLRQSAQAVIRLGGGPVRGARHVVPATGRGAGHAAPRAEPASRPARRERGDHPAAGKRAGAGGPASRPERAARGKPAHDNLARGKPAHDKPARDNAARDKPARGTTARGTTARGTTARGKSARGERGAGGARDGRSKRDAGGRRGRGAQDDRRGPGLRGGHRPR